MHGVPRYQPKRAKFCWFGLEGRFRHFFGNIIGLGTYFSKPIFALKPWVRAGQFEYHEPHNRNNIFSTCIVSVKQTHILPIQGKFCLTNIVTCLKNLTDTDTGKDDCSSHILYILMSWLQLSYSLHLDSLTVALIFSSSWWEDYSSHMVCILITWQQPQFSMNDLNNHVLHRTTKKK